MTVTPKAHTAIVARIAALRARHRALDDQVAAEQRRAWPEAGMLQMLKRRRLRLKDELKRCEGLLRRRAQRRVPG